MRHMWRESEQQPHKTKGLKGPTQALTITAQVTPVESSDPVSKIQSQHTHKDRQTETDKQAGRGGTLHSRKGREARHILLGVTSESHALGG